MQAMCCRLRAIRKWRNYNSLQFRRSSASLILARSLQRAAVLQLMMTRLVHSSVWLVAASVSQCSRTTVSSATISGSSRRCFVSKKVGPPLLLRLQFNFRSQTSTLQLLIDVECDLYSLAQRDRVGPSLCTQRDEALQRVDHARCACKKYF